MASIRGKKRQEYIQKWLNGEEDPEVEVKPTRVEGKYIVRPREQNETLEDNPPPTSASMVPASDNGQQDSSSYYSEYEEEEEKPEPVIKHRKSKKMSNNDVQLEILHQLRIMGEEAIRKRDKKERKREMKHVVRKEMARHDRYYEYDSDSDPEPAPQMVYTHRPTYKRRTLNLLSDYR